MPSKGKSTKKLVSPEDIRTLAFKRGVTVLLDVNGTSEEAKIGTPYSYSSKSKVLRIIVPNWKDEHKPILLEIIRKIFNREGLIWKSEKEQILESYKEYASLNKYQNVIEFFSGIIPRADFNALKMAFFLRDQKEKGLSVSVYKNNIRDRFGDRGSNIANLCTAGYFEAEFMPLYNQVSKEEFSEYYERAVGEKARAIFVHGGMTRDDIEGLFQETLEKALKFHIENFRIHGMGTHNVETIKQFVTSKPVTPEDAFVIQKDYEKSLPTPVIGYTVTIIQKPAVN